MKVIDKSRGRYKAVKTIGDLTSNFGCCPNEEVRKNMVRAPTER